MLKFEDQWTGDHLDFRARMMGQSIVGRLDIQDDHVHVELDLPGFLASIASKLTGKIQKEGQVLLERSRPETGSPPRPASQGFRRVDAAQRRLVRRHRAAERATLDRLHRAQPRHHGATLTRISSLRVASSASSLEDHHDLVVGRRRCVIAHDRGAGIASVLISSPTEPFRSDPAWAPCARIAACWK